MADACTDNGVSTPEVYDEEEKVFPVFLIHSKWSLDRIDNFLNTFGEVGFLRIVYDGNGNETDRNIAILSESAYEKLCDEGYDKRQYGKGLVISRYSLRDNNFPGDGKTSTLFVPVPKTLSADDDGVIKIVTNKLKSLSAWDIIPEDSWSVTAPLRSREKGVIRGGCFISFKKNVSLSARAMVRVLITDTYWPESESENDNNTKLENPIFHCFWSRARKERQPKESNTNQDSLESKEEKKKESIKKMVKNAQPVSSSKKQQKDGGKKKKTSTVPIPKGLQPSLTA